MSGTPIVDALEEHRGRTARLLDRLGELGWTGPAAELRERDAQLGLAIEALQREAVASARRPRRSPDPLHL